MTHLIKSPKLEINIPKVYFESDSENGGSWPLFSDPVENFVCVQGIFTDSEINKIIQIGEMLELKEGRTGGPNSLDIRNSYVRFLNPNNITGWIFEKLSSSILSVNDSYFKFDITSLDQGLQFTKYSAPGQHYSWHIDRGQSVGVRKLSLTVQLSDPDDYEGGDLELLFGKDPVSVSRQKGVITFFPSYVLHRVTPVTKGTRYSLVCWVSGPPFR